MADYQNMYIQLFNAVTYAINILQEAQIETEDKFISQEDPKIVLLKHPDDSK